ncbi:MAG: hypothetical protein ACYCQI_15385 [Gammaproteobacteria bacterium]
MRERKSEDSNTKSTWNINLFKSESKEEAWERLNTELNEHLSSIYYKLYSVSSNPSTHTLLHNAYSKNVGDDTLDALREEIKRLNSERRSSNKCCTRCGEVTKCVCVLISMLADLIDICRATRPSFRNSISFYPDIDFSNPEHEESPFKNLATAIKSYNDWYIRIPKYFTDGSIATMNIQKSCEVVKRKYPIMRINEPLAQEDGVSSRATIQRLT